ncbi:MAG: hypothetical protein KAJ98_07055 [Spirochaetaceae bacterium]|nr:hypothetical protein [Spirochaetaceae bacterium]
MSEDKHLEPEVGIFWIHEGKLFHVESTPLSKAIHTQVSIDYANGHYASWFILDKRGFLDQLPPYMRDEYDSISRGRVVYLNEKKSFVIYHGDDFNDSTRRELMDLLNLPEDATIDEIDEHYNPLPEDFLF